MFLREYVYVDVDRVAGLAGQLYDGVPQKAIKVAARQKRIDVDLKLLKSGRHAGSEESTERSLADGLFKDLENDLESLGLLRDYSDDLAHNDSWEKVEQLLTAGQIIRITAPGTLFHPAQMSEAILGIATAAMGLADLGLDKEGTAPRTAIPPKAKSPEQKLAERAANRSAAEPRHPEDYLPSVPNLPVMDVPRRLLSGLIRVTRGTFSEGVHLHLRPLGVDGPLISARLEPGRRFLDSSPEVLFSRYGLAEQEWTAVGVIGQFGSRISPPPVSDVTNVDGTVNRARFVDLVGNFLATSAGLVDLPSAPGFSLIPLAVYRSIGEGFAIDE